MNFADVFFFHARRYACAGFTMALGVIGALFAFSAGANAQSFDGVYKGTMRFTEDITLRSSRQPCTPVGTVRTPVFRVAGSTITVTGLGESFSGTVGSDGRFSIVTSFTDRGSRNARGSREWKGEIKGSRIEGAYQLQGPGAICRAVFSTKK